MSTATKPRQIDYPTSDGKPMAETDLHRDLMIDSIKTLEQRYADQADVYVSGNLLVFYVPGDKRKHVAPDVFVAFGVPKRKRDNFLCWEERRFPRVLIEITSKSTKNEDIKTKKDVYRDVFKAHEYILLDPTGDYLKPRLQGFRRVRGQWKSIPVEDGKLFCETLGLELHVDGNRFRFFDPETKQYLATPDERAEQAEEQAAEARENAADAARQAADAAQREAEAKAEQQRLAAENERLRREVEELRRQRNGG